MSTTHKAAFVAIVFALAACQPAAKPPETAAAGAPESADVDGCNLHVESPWIEQETPLRRYTAEASSMGPTCQQSVVTLAIRAREATPVYTWSGRAEDLMTIRDAADPAAMKTALEEWISNPSTMPTTAELPLWETTEGQPKRAEFPFMPESWIDQATWDKLRADKLDMFCFVQGGESLRCAVLRDGQMEDIGLQLFPG